MVALHKYKIITNPEYKDLESIAERVRRLLGTENESTQANLNIVIGGDGTVLYSQLYDDDGQYYLGIRKRGSVGFYTALDVDELEKIRDIMNGNFYICELTRLKTRFGNSLNEIQIHPKHPHKLLKINLEIVLSNGKTVTSEEYNSGLLVYTPTGASGFARNLDGAFGINSIGLVAIAPSKGLLRNYKAITIPINLFRTIRVYGKAFLVSVDSQTLGEADSLEIKIANPLKYVMPKSVRIKENNITSYCRTFLN